MKQRNLNLPNSLTALRLIAAPFLALLLFKGEYWEALAVFLMAGLSDAADGWLAKRFDLATDLGRILDPVADKLLMLAGFVALAAIGAVPVWLAALVIGRDLAIVMGVLLTWALGLPLRVAPSYLGKASTAIQISYLALMLVFLVAGFALPALSRALDITVAVITVAAGLNYAGLWLKALGRSSRMA